MKELYNSRIQEENDFELSGGKYILDDDEIPFEVRMKYILKAYRKDREKWARLLIHTKQLQEKLAENSKTIKGLREKVSQFEQERKHYKNAKNQSSVLESRMVSSLLSENKVDGFKSIIDSQNDYINVLQEILYKNNIAYPPKRIK
jgi:predicted RNase H-like nuclease (RuvC/YqgF family)